MKAEYYLFTLFVFALICAGLYLFRKLFHSPDAGRRGRSEEDTAREREREERLFRLYQNMEEMMDNFEGYIEDAKEEIEGVRAAVQKQADQMAELCRRAVEAEAGVQAAASQLRAEKAAVLKREERPAPEPAPAAPEPRRSSRQDAVKELLGKGNTVEQIAQKLDISINEVRLIVYGLMTRGVEQK